MSLSIEKQKELTSNWFKELQSQMITSFESLDSAKFKKTSWDRPGGGGGTMAVMKGEVFGKRELSPLVGMGKKSGPSSGQKGGNFSDRRDRKK